MVLKQPKYQQKYPVHRRICLAFVNVCLVKVKKGIWLPATAHGEMKKAGPWLRRVAPEVLETPLWISARSSFTKFQHKKNKAPTLSWDELENLADCCGSWRHRAIFWLVVMTCSRIGYLEGLVVEEITSTHARTILVRHKTASKVNQMSLTLPYWNETMRRQVFGFIAPGCSPRLA